MLTLCIWMAQRGDNTTCILSTAALGEVAAQSPLRQGGDEEWHVTEAVVV